MPRMAVSFIIQHMDYTALVKPSNGTKTTKESDDARDFTRQLVTRTPFLSI
jgi:hypothetical protein